VSGLNTFVDDEKGLSIRFEGVIGSPILSGISIRKDFPASKLNCFYGHGFKFCSKILHSASPFLNSEE
jgi:hypothetical protein